MNGATASSDTSTSFWQEQAVDRLLALSPQSVPTLSVGGLFDQEDICGSIAGYAAMEQSDTRNDRNFLVLGPWFHGCTRSEASNE
jgi:hypothetical protein